MMEPSKIPVSYIGHRKRLRERFQKTELDGFADYEIIELLLTLAIPRSDVKRPAKLLIQRFGNLRGILDASPEDLQRIEGIGSVTPIAIKVIRSMATLYLQQKSEDIEVLSNISNLSSFWRMHIGGTKNEIFQVAFLDSGYRLMHDGVKTLEEGIVDRVTVHPRRIIESALKRGAFALVLAHNHPNDDVKPSEQDKLLTRAIVLAAETVNLKIYDHLIISKNAVFSFRGEGLL